MGKYNFPESETDQRVALTRRLQRLESSPQLPNSSVSGGVGGTSVPVNGLAYGEKASTNSRQFICAGDSVWRLDPLDVGLTVIVTTGRILITLSAMMWQSIGASNAILSYYGTGPTTSIVEDPMRGIVVPALNGAQAYSGGSFSFLHEGLENGSWFFKMKYGCFQYGTSADSAFFQARTMIAKPY